MVAITLDDKNTIQPRVDLMIDTIKKLKEVGFSSMKINVGKIIVLELDDKKEIILNHIIIPVVS